MMTAYVFGLLVSFGVLFTRLLDIYQESRAAVVSIQAISFGMSDGAGILSGILVARLGLWKATMVGAFIGSFGYILSFLSTSVVQLYFLIGLPVGLGTGIIYIASTTALGMTYEGPQRVMAVAIQNASQSVTSITFPYFLTFLADTYGVNGTFLIIGGICLNCIPGAMLFAILERNYTKDHVNSTITDAKHSESSCFEATKREFVILKQTILSILTIPYVLNCLGAGLTIGTVIAFLAIIVDVLSWKGCSESQALLAFPIAFATGFAARLLVGFAKNCTAGQSLIVSAVYSFAGCCGFLLVFIFSNVSAILSGCGLMGIAISGSLSAAIVVVVQILKEEQISVGVGLVLTGIGISTASLGPLFVRTTNHISWSWGLVLTGIGISTAATGQLFGSMRDMSKSYSGVLIVASSLNFLSGCLYIGAVITWRFSAKKTVPHEENNKNKEHNEKY